LTTPAPSLKIDLMARNLTSPLFSDGLWSVVWEESDGKQYLIIDNDGTRE
jgi:hypothetical protein